MLYQKWPRTASRVPSLLHTGHSFSAEPATAQQCAASMSAHLDLPQSFPSSVSSCSTVTPVQTSHSVSVLTLSWDNGWHLATTAQSPENPLAYAQQQTQLPPPTGIEHRSPAPTALKAAHWQEKHHGAAPSSLCHPLSHSSLSSSAIHREQQMLHSKTVPRAREIYFGISYVSHLQVDIVPKANGINRRREICAGALLQHKDVFRAGHTSLPACPSNLHLQMLLSRVLLR